MMSSQEISTAVHYNAKIIILLINNSSYATIRMHQERDYPGRKIATDLKNPDFVKLCKAMGADAYRVNGVEDFSQIFVKALRSKKRRRVIEGLSQRLNNGNGIRFPCYVNWVGVCRSNCSIVS